MARRPGQPKGVRSRIKDARRYEQLLRQTYLSTWMGVLQDKLAEVAAINQAYYALRDALDTFTALPRSGVPVDRIEAYLDELSGYHRRELISRFRAALGVNIAAVLSDPPIRAFLAEKLVENVGLIKTIPQRFHDGLRGRLERELAEAPFDQSRLRAMLSQEYKSAGYNLRRLTRDQTNKVIGNLSQIRQQQVGIREYVWSTSQDERVRPTHRANNGRVFKWDEPPAGTGHPGFDIQCRCVALPIVTASDRERLGAVIRPEGM